MTLLRPTIHAGHHDPMIWVNKSLWQSGKPDHDTDPKVWPMFARTGIILIVLAILIGPYFSDPQYDWVQHTTSQLGGQTMPKAWIMNLGFVAYGCGIIVNSAFNWQRAKLINLAAIGFGVGLIGSAVWSAQPIPPLPPINAVEDQFHSFFSTFVGFGFAATTTAAIFGPGGRLKDPLSWIGLLASVAIPTLMFAFPLWDGALQRVMFAISFVWFWRQSGRRFSDH